MKRKLLLFLFIFISSSAILQAQISKGSIFLGGSFGVSNYKAKADVSAGDAKTTSYSFSPAVGKAIKDNLVFGVELTVSGFDNDISTTYSHELFSAGGGVFWRRYFEVLNKFYLFGHGRIGAAYAREKSFNAPMYADSKGYNISASVYPGMSYAVKKNIHIEMSMNNLVQASFGHRKVSYTGTSFSSSKINEFNIGSNLFSQSGFSVGIRFLL